MINSRFWRHFYERYSQCLSMKNNHGEPGPDPPPPPSVTPQPKPVSHSTIWNRNLHEHTGFSPPLGFVICFESTGSGLWPWILYAKGRSSQSMVVPISFERLSRCYVLWAVSILVS